MNIDNLFYGFKVKDPCQKEIPIEKWDIYAERKFCPKIQVTNWWYHREGYPKDYDDAVHAAYKRWGNCEEDESHWTTETMQAMTEGKGEFNPDFASIAARPLKMLTFLSYPITIKTRKDLLPEEIRKILPSLPRDVLTLRYTTTNQAHYKKVHIHPK